MSVLTPKALEGMSLDQLAKLEGEILSWEKEDRKENALLYYQPVSDRAKAIHAERTTTISTPHSAADALVVETQSMVHGDLRKCTKCSAAKSTSEFGKHAKCKNGINTQCKLCCLERGKKWYRKNIELTIQRSRERYKSKTQEILSKNKQRKLLRREAIYKYNKKYESVHSEQVKIWKRRWRKRNPEAVRAIDNKRRCLELSAHGIATKLDWIARAEIWGCRCWICGSPSTGMDHVKPLTKGGSNWPANLRPICKSCNSRKSNKWLGVTRLLELKLSLWA